MTIKESFMCDYISGDDKELPLPRWYNSLINKQIDEVNIADVLKMIRQKLFLSIALPKAVDFLRDNCFAGELYDGELMQLMYRQEMAFCVKNRSIFESIVQTARDKYLDYSLFTEDEKKEFGNFLDNFEEALHAVA
jgi:hypothetical protein